MSFNPGDTVIHSTWCGASLVTLLSASDNGVHVRASDGHVDFLPASGHVTTGDILARFRHPSAAELALYSDPVAMAARDDRPFGAV
jgi:hypothetical protein